MTPPRKLTAAQREFLALLRRFDDANRRPCRSVIGLADRETDRMRQTCRKTGWAIYQTGRWGITPAGRAALEDEHG